MIRFKSCPKCRGDLMLDWDFLGWFEQCLQCGNMHYLQKAWATHRMSAPPVAPLPVPAIVAPPRNPRRRTNSSRMGLRKRKKWELARVAGRMPWWPSQHGA